MIPAASANSQPLCRPPRGGRGLKSKRNAQSHSTGQSPSSRRAWIEILDLGKLDADMLVALLAEGVD